MGERHEALWHLQDLVLVAHPDDLAILYTFQELIFPINMEMGFAVFSLG